MTLYIVKYKGAFGFIKPWTAVRDAETFTQQFLTPSIIEGIEKKLFPEFLGETGIQKIVRHRLRYDKISTQQEKTWSKGGFKAENERGVWKTNQGVIDRGIMINPVLHLAFNELVYAEKALEQTICLTRNEDLAFPTDQLECDETDFDKIDGFELHYQKNDNIVNQIFVGYNRFDSSKKMFGELRVYGNPVGILDEKY
ncbi:MAG: hypothetical protein J0M25_07465 [Flavobacteriales bacterium]|nr:hypothetical protein [Flavobacteriales bacterium]